MGCGNGVAPGYCRDKCRKGIYGNKRITMGSVGDDERWEL